MELPAVVLLVLVALLVGVVVGVCLAAPAPPALGSDPSAPDPPAVPEPPPAPPPAPPPPEDKPSQVRERFLGATREVARAVLAHHQGDIDDDQAERLAFALSALAADGWALGVSELREALVHGSGLPPELIDEAATTALRALERGPR